MRKWTLIAMAVLLSGCSHNMDIEYLNAPRLIPYQRYDFRLSEPFMVRINQSIEVVPTDFITDLASVPRILWSIYSPNDTATIRAAILHDYMYRCDTEYTRWEADRIFYYALIRSGVTKFRANKYYYGVRLFGWMFWQSDKC